MFALLLADLKMLVRNRQALFWALAFPLIFVVIFGLFDLEGSPSVDLAVVDQAQDNASRAIVESLSSLDFFNLNESYADEAAARAALEEGDVYYILLLPPWLERRLGEAARGSDPVALTLIEDEGSIQTNSIVHSVIQQFLSSMNLELAGAPQYLALAPTGLKAKRVSYFDFLLPGFVAMGVMTYAVIGMASLISLYRQQKILKRLLATPLKIRTFFAAQILAYLLLSMVQAAVILAAGVILFDAQIFGNLLWLFVLVLLGNIIFLNLGFLVGAFAKSVEAANGLGNAIVMPMMFLSGVFFPTEGLPTVLAQAVQFLPLTPLLEAMRGVLIDANPLWHYPSQLGLLAVWIAVSAALAVRTFRF